MKQITLKDGALTSKNQNHHSSVATTLSKGCFSYDLNNFHLVPRAQNTQPLQAIAIPSGIKNRKLSFSVNWSAQVMQCVVPNYDQAETDDVYMAVENQESGLK